MWWALTCPPYRAHTTAITLYLPRLCYAYAMSRYRRADVPGATYFFTVVTYRRRPILCDAPVRAALRSAVTAIGPRETSFYN
jgi:hypothetical protein